MSTVLFKQIDLGSGHWLECLSSLARALGRKSFEHELMASLNRVLLVDHCAVFTYENAAVGHLFTRGKVANDVGQSLAEDYIHGFHARDPMFAKLSGPATEGSLRPYALSPMHSYDPGYRRHFFDRANLVDKASTIEHVERGSVLCNFYRLSVSGAYSHQEWIRLERVLPVITSLISTHYSLVSTSVRNGAGRGPRERVRSLVHAAIDTRNPPFDRLTPRESAVCERILLGLTSIGIGLDLEIAESSVLTYRKRAYEKLGISTQSQLFGLCLAAVSDK